MPSASRKAASRRHATSRRTIVAVIPPVDELDLVGPLQVFNSVNRLAGRTIYSIEVVTNAERLMWNERAIVLAEGESLIGRDPGCAVWLDAPGVSRRHARINVAGGGDVVRLEDLGSTNGTLVDGSPVRGVVQVADGSVIRFGRVDLTLRIWSRGKASETERIARPS